MTAHSTPEERLQDRFEHLFVPELRSALESMTTKGIRVVDLEPLAAITKVANPNSARAYLEVWREGLPLGLRRTDAFVQNLSQEKLQAQADGLSYLLHQRKIPSTEPVISKVADLYDKYGVAFQYPPQP